MVHELKQHLEEGKVYFGIKQSLKNSPNLHKVVVPSDCRDQIKRLLKVNKIDLEVINFSKAELAQKLELEFECEVFGLGR